MKGGRIALQPDRTANVLDGNLVPPHLMGNYAQKMNCIDLIRLDREDLSIRLLGGLQAARLMMLDRDRQQFGNGRHAISTGMQLAH